MSTISDLLARYGRMQMRLFLLWFNFAALLFSIYGFKDEYRLNHDEPMLYIVFGVLWALLLLNLAYIQTTPRTFSFRDKARKFKSGWNAAKN